MMVTVGVDTSFTGRLDWLGPMFGGRLAQSYIH